MTALPGTRARRAGLLEAAVIEYAESGCHRARSTDTAAIALVLAPEYRPVG